MTGTGGFPRLGGAATEGAASTVEVVQDMGLHLGGGGERGGRVQANRDLHSSKAEYSHAVYCDANYSGPVRGVGE